MTPPITNLNASTQFGAASGLPANRPAIPACILPEGFSVGGTPANGPAPLRDSLSYPATPATGDFPPIGGSPWARSLFAASYGSAPAASAAPAPTAAAPSAGAGTTT